MSTEEQETWQENSQENTNADREESRSFNREYRKPDYNRQDRPQRPRFTRAGSSEPAGSYNAEGGARPRRPRIGSGATPAYHSDGTNSYQTEEGGNNYRSYNRNNNYDRGGNRYDNNYDRGNGYNRQDRPQRPRSYNPNFRNNNGEQRQWRPNNNNYNNSYNRYDNQGGNRYDNGNQYEPNGNRWEGGEDGAQQQRPSFRRPSFNNNQGGNRYDNNGGGYSNRGYNNNGGYNRGGYNHQGGNRYDNNGGYNNGGYRQQGGGFRQQQGGGAFRPRRTADYDPNAKYSKKKQFEYKDTLTDPNEPIRLNKFLANAGVCSRREADEYIAAGVVSVNGEVVTELGTKVKRSDEVKFHEQPVNIERKIYVLLNKPKDCVTTAEDTHDRKTVMDYVKGACKERIYPVGRLDRNTTGVLLLTNDGDLASKLTHPKYLKKKVYHVFCDKNVAKADLDQIAAGITLDDGEIHADAISYASETDKSQVGIEIHSGKNRIVRRIFESLGYRVVKLDRVFFAGLTKKNLRRGQWRYLNEKEVNMLRMGAFE